MTRRTQSLAVALTLLLPLGLAAHAPPASACNNEVVRATKRAVRVATGAEMAIETGKTAAGVEGLLSLSPLLRSSRTLLQEEYGTGVDRVAARMQRLVAVAVVRTEGLLAVGDDYPAATAADRRRNLEWAIGILRAFDRLSGGPASQTDLAEALSKLPETRDEARTTLEGLAAKDLVTSPQGYAVLAELRLAAGDRAKSEEARARFEKMRSTPPTVHGERLFSRGE